MDWGLVVGILVHLAGWSWYVRRCLRADRAALERRAGNGGAG